MMAAFAQLRGFEETVEVGVDAEVGVDVTGSVLEASEGLEASLKLGNYLPLLGEHSRKKEKGEMEDGKDDGKVVQDDTYIKGQYYQLLDH